MSKYIVGRNPVIEHLQRGTQTVKKIWIAKGNTHARIQHIVTMAGKAGVPIKHCTRRELDRLESSVPHQGVIALVSPARYNDLSSILAKIERSEHNALLIVLDNIQDPRNLGAILRTAEAVNADAVIIPKNHAVGITAAVHKASAGASTYVPIAKVANIAHTIDTLKNSGIWVAGAAEDASCLYTDADFSVPLCLVLGSEGKGLRRLVKQKCDYLVHLPMLGKIDSLNVSVAAGVLLYEVIRQRDVK
ncbi:23S rRNA (guanosine(2251)-2'-O)-methyltransferase RlmB [Candidatus Poribacteria bacterium]|nr:MAG: 23S rRNA (guanosine(2251)-2'-O)-methyltransferase RlmB [Candidatus Poribacteria bacterium]